MIILRDVLIRPGIIDSERVCALSLPCQLFYRNLLHACDGAGHFPADAAELRSAFYWRSPRVSSPHVEAWMVKCHQARLVKLYTRGGRPYGEILNYGQRDTNRRILYPPPDEAELNFAAPASPDEKPPPLIHEVKGREGKKRKAPRAPANGLGLEESQPDWIARLERQWPAVDVVTELLRAERDRLAQKKVLERAWFEKAWLPGCSPVVRLQVAGNGAPQVIEAEPEGWRAFLNERYHDESWAQTAQIYQWGELPDNWRRKVSREVK